MEITAYETKYVNDSVEKGKDIYLLINQGKTIGSIACYGNEIDDLIVNKKDQEYIRICF